MRYLLDTHVVLWWLADPKNIKTKTQKIISNTENEIFISSVSFWEMAIKKSIGRLTLPYNIIETLMQDGFKILPILAAECLSVSDLPLLHADPFDRLLIMQSKLNDLVLITNDQKISMYPVITLEA